MHIHAYSQSRPEAKSPSSKVRNVGTFGHQFVRNSVTIAITTTPGLQASKSAQQVCSVPNGSRRCNLPVSVGRLESMKFACCVWSGGKPSSIFLCRKAARVDLRRPGMWPDLSERL